MEGFSTSNLLDDNGTFTGENLLDDNGTFIGEKTVGPINNSLRGLKVIETAKEDLENA